MSPEECVSDTRIFCALVVFQPALFITWPPQQRLGKLLVLRMFLYCPQVFSGVSSSRTIVRGSFLIPHLTSEQLQGISTGSSYGPVSKRITGLHRHPTVLLFKSLGFLRSAGSKKWYCAPPPSPNPALTRVTQEIRKPFYSREKLRPGQVHPCPQGAQEPGEKSHKHEDDLKAGLRASQEKTMLTRHTAGQEGKGSAGVSEEAAFEE